MNRYFTNRPRARAAALLALSCLAFVIGGAHAARQPGAPRALALRFTDDLPLLPDISSLSRPIVGPPLPVRDGNAEPIYPLYFTRGDEGSSNIYRAELQLRHAPLPRAYDARASEVDEADAELNGDTRFVTSIAPLVAAPITKLAAPLWARNAVPLPDGRTLLCVTNALATPREREADFDQIVRLDLRNGTMRALTAANARHGAPTVSPDGRAFAHDSDRGGVSAIYITPVDTNGAPGSQSRRVALMARRPAWLDDDSILIENLQPGSVGLARLELRTSGNAAPAVRRLWPRGGQSTFDGRTLCVAAPLVADNAAPASVANEETGATRLYLLAPDGSGARALTGTEGADNPLFAPDGSFLLYDAPQSTVEIDRTSAADPARGLWMVPMRRVAPVARIDGVRVLSGNAFAVVGTAFSNDNTPRALVEWGEGRTPNRWNSLPTTAPAHSAVLARWTAPSQVGEWTLRLRVEDAEGDSSSSSLFVKLPLGGDADVPTPLIFASPPLPTKPPAAQSTTPLPVLPSSPNEKVEPFRIGERAPESPVSNPPITRPTTQPAPPRVPPRVKKPAARATPQPTPSANPSAAGDAAVLTVTGIPYSVQPGETLSLSALLRNTGRNGWKVSGDSAVRLLVRWHDANTKGRTRWAIRWLRADVAPGAVGKLDFTIPAPPRAGDYILRFSLVRVGSDGYTPPPFSQSANDRYPGEFGVATTTMPVSP